MAQVTFTRHLERYLSAPPRNVVGDTVARALACIFDANPQLRGYVLDDQGRLREHVTVFVDGRMVNDRLRLSDTVCDDSRIFVMQALSGG